MKMKAITCRSLPRETEMLQTTECILCSHG